MEISEDVKTTTTASRKKARDNLRNISENSGKKFQNKL